MSSNTVPLFSFCLSYVVPPCKLNINKLSLTFYFHLDDKLKHAQTHPYTNPSNTRYTRWVQHKNSAAVFLLLLSPNKRTTKSESVFVENKVIALLSISSPGLPKKSTNSLEYDYFVKKDRCCILQRYQFSRCCAQTMINKIGSDCFEDF